MIVGMISGRRFQSKLVIEPYSRVKKTDRQQWQKINQMGKISGTVKTAL